MDLRSAIEDSKPNLKSTFTNRDDLSSTLHKIICNYIFLFFYIWVKIKHRPVL